MIVPRCGEESLLETCGRAQPEAGTSGRLQSRCDPEPSRRKGGRERGAGAASRGFKGTKRVGDQNG